MDKAYILSQMELIKIAANNLDDEVAHSIEDRIRNYFISELTKEDGEIGEVAKLILSTNLIEFTRHCS